MTRRAAKDCLVFALDVPSAAAAEPLPFWSLRE